MSIFFSRFLDNSGNLLLGCVHSSMNLRMLLCVEDVHFFPNLSQTEGERNHFACSQQTCSFHNKLKNVSLCEREDKSSFFF